MKGAAALALALYSALSLGLGAQTPLRQRADRQAAVATSRASAGRWWVDFEFPPLTARQLACPTGRSSDRMHERGYLWRIIARPPEPTDWNTPFMQVDIQFWLPLRTPLTPARLDSAIALQRPTVDELSGEPPQARRHFTPVQAWARVERGGVRVRVEGEAAVRAILRARNDEVTLVWCNGRVTVPYAGGPVTLR